MPGLDKTTFNFLFFLYFFPTNFHGALDQCGCENKTTKKITSLSKRGISFIYPRTQGVSVDFSPGCHSFILRRDEFILIPIMRCSTFSSLQYRRPMPPGTHPLHAVSIYSDIVYIYISTTKKIRHVAIHFSCVIYFIVFARGLLFHNIPWPRSRTPTPVTSLPAKPFVLFPVPRLQRTGTIKVPSSRRALLNKLSGF